MILVCFSFIFISPFSRVAAEAEHGYAVSLPPTLMYESSQTTTNVITTPPPQQVQQRSAPIAFHGKFSQNNNTVILASSAPASTSTFAAFEEPSALLAAGRNNKRLAKLSNKKPQGNRSVDIHTLITSLQTSAAKLPIGCQKISLVEV